MTRNSFDLEVRDLTIEYVSGGYTVRPIHGLDLDGARGEIMLLLGASGCGKTTVLSVLAAILTPTAGRVRFDDIDVTGLRGAPLNRYRQHTVGIMFQAFNLVPSLTARENIQVPLSTARVSGRAARQRAGALLAQVGLSERARHRPGDLSGGQQQRVAIAAPWPTTRPSCWPTSPPRIWTTPRSTGSYGCYARSPMPVAW
jgi:putative ABC transport system ATP-binding protein